MAVDFTEFQSLFDDTWDMAYLSREDTFQASMSPIKAKYHVFGRDFTNGIHFPDITHGIVMCKFGESWDYSFYKEIINTIKKSNIMGWYPMYTNYKEAAILSGLGVRARNTLVYSYKFGFDCHFAMVGFKTEITNIPDKSKKIQHNMWKKCTDCYDCINACPARAIHYNEKNDKAWLDGGACENLIFFGTTPEGKYDSKKIPSVISYWHENCHPEVDKKVVDSVKTVGDMHKVNNMQWDANGYAYDGNNTTKDGVNIRLPHCRECTAQPRCSKYEGKFPYDSIV